MKKLLLLALLAATIFYSCKKDEEETLDSAKIQGRWDLVKEYVLTKKDGVKTSDSTDTSAIIKKNYFTILITDINLYKRDSFLINKVKVLKDSLLSKGQFTFLPGNSLKIKFSNGDSTNYNINWVTDKKFIVKTNSEKTIDNTKYNYYYERTYIHH